MSLESRVATFDETTKQNQARVVKLCTLACQLSKSGIMESLTFTNLGALRGQNEHLRLQRPDSLISTTDRNGIPLYF